MLLTSLAIVIGVTKNNELEGKQDEINEMASEIKVLSITMETQQTQMDLLINQMEHAMSEKVIAQKELEDLMQEVKEAKEKAEAEAAQEKETDTVDDGNQGTEEQTEGTEDKEVDDSSIDES